MGSNIHETLIFNTEPLECRSKQLHEEAKERSRAAGEEMELPEREWHGHAAALRSPVDVAKQAQWPEQSSSWHGESLRTPQCVCGSSSHHPWTPWWPGALLGGDHL